MNEVLDSSELRRIHLEVLESTSEEEVLERFRQAKREFDEQRRQRVLESAQSIMSSYSTQYAGIHVQTPPTLMELRQRLQKLPPKAVEARLQEMREDLGSYENFEALFDKRMEERIPANWMYMWGTREEAKAALKEQNRDQLETVQKAIPYLKEMIDVAENVLREKQCFIQANAAEVPKLIRECVELTRQALDVKERVDRLLYKLERSSLKERDKDKVAEKIIELIRRHKELESQCNPRLSKLHEYQPEPSAEWRDMVSGFPASRYNLPTWLQTRLEHASR